MKTRLTCPVCEFKTTSNYVSKRLTDVHHKEATAVACSVCEEKFKTKGERKKHINNQHAEVTLQQKQPGKKVEVGVGRIAVTCADNGSMR